MRRLRLLQVRAREGRSVEEASEFARWVRMSHLLWLFEAFKAPPPLEVSPEAVVELIRGIQSDCEAFWKKDPRGAWVDKSEVEQLNQKVDMLMAGVAKIAGMISAQDKTASNLVHDVPGLKVLTGGEDAG